MVDSSLALVADIGGTHARFAVADLDARTIARMVVFRCDAFASLQAAVAAYLGTISERPSLAALAIAGPVTGDAISLTNHDWHFTREELREATGAERLQLVNDFEALALSLPLLAGSDLHRVARGEPAERATKVIVGPGTGLGVAGLAFTPTGWMALPGEGGHVSFAAESREEFEVVERIRQDGGHVSAERLISGPGIVSIYRALGELRGAPGEAVDAAAIVTRAQARRDPFAVEALGLFVTFLARFAGDLALIYGARGGVYLGGGILPRIMDELERQEFAAAFRAKGRLSHFLAPIPVDVIVAPDAGLRGAAASLASPAAL